MTSPSDTKLVTMAGILDVLEVEALCEMQAWDSVVQVVQVNTLTLLSRYSC